MPANSTDSMLSPQVIAAIGQPVVVVVRGEQDQSNVAALAAALATAAESGSDVSVDLGCTTFASASTVGALLRAHEALLARDRVLTVRSPSPAAERLLQICGVEWLIDRSDDARPQPSGTPPAT